MGVLERVVQMKQRGMLDQQIFRYLREEGVSPREISDAISQSRIKGAINFNNDEEFPEITQPINSMAMQKSIMSKGKPSQREGYESYPSETYSPEYPTLYPGQPYSETSGEPYAPYSETALQEPLPEVYQEYSPDFSSYQEYQPPQSTDIETINEIAEQITDEKIDRFKKEMSSFTKFREEMISEITKMNERVQKIESLFDELQMAIIRKIGSYGEDIKNISKEVQITQASFSKILDPLTENIKELQKITNSGERRASEKRRANEKESEEIEKSESKETRKALKKSKPSFEDYLK